MIKGLRIDYRLLHGQVVYSYIAKLGADAVLLASDELMNNPLELETIKLTRPRNVKVVAKNVADGIQAVNSGVTDKYHLLVICKTIEEAYRFAKGTGVMELNLGGSPNKDGRICLAQAVYVNSDEVKLLKKLVSEGVHCFVQGSANDKEIDIRDHPLIKGE